jgi:hypothetical protein
VRRCDNKTNKNKTEMRAPRKTKRKKTHQPARTRKQTFVAENPRKKKPEKQHETRRENQNVRVNTTMKKIQHAGSTFCEVCAAE